MRGMQPATAILDVRIHPGCGRLQEIPKDDFVRWWMMPRYNRDGTENPFVPLREFTRSYCLCSYTPPMFPTQR